jgi:hypothetical protein
VMGGAVNMITKKPSGEFGFKQTLSYGFDHDDLKSITHLDTPELNNAVDRICASQPGFNFGRLDVKAHSQEAFQAGEFVVIEVNGIASLPTHMFDPKNSLARAYRIFLEHGKWLVKIAAEHRHQPMELSNYGEIWQRAKTNYQVLNAIHNRALERG